MVGRIGFYAFDMCITIEPFGRAGLGWGEDLSVQGLGGEGLGWGEDLRGLLCIHLFEPMDMEIAFDEGGVVKDFLVKLDIACDSCDDQFCEGSFHALNGVRTVCAVGDNFCDEAVIVRRDEGAVIDSGIDANSGSARGQEGFDMAWLRGEGFGVFCIDSAFDGVSVGCDIVLREREGFA